MPGGNTQECSLTRGTEGYIVAQHPYLLAGPNSFPTPSQPPAVVLCSLTGPVCFFFLSSLLCLCFLHCLPYELVVSCSGQDSFWGIQCRMVINHSVPSVATPGGPHPWPYSYCSNGVTVPLCSRKHGSAQTSVLASIPGTLVSLMPEHHQTK